MHAIETHIDGAGNFRFCGMPRPMPIVLRASSLDGVSDTLVVRVPESRLAIAVLKIDRGAPMVATVTGTVVDNLDRPIVGAEIAITGRANVTTTGPQGEFRISDIEPGAMVVHARKIGFQPADFEVALGPRQSRTLRMSLRAMAVLDTVAVVESALLPTSYEDHKRLGLGKFIDRDQLDRQKGRTVAAILAELPRVRVINGTGNRRWLATNKHLSIKGSGLVRGDMVDSLHGSPYACYPQVYLDNIRMFRAKLGEPLFDLGTVNPDQIEAIEFFESPAQTPIEYGGTDSQCGVLVIWTRRSHTESRTTNPPN